MTVLAVVPAAAAAPRGPARPARLRGGLPLVRRAVPHRHQVFDEAGNKLVDVRVGNTDFCGYIWTKASAREQCMATVARVKSDPSVRSRPRSRSTAISGLPLRGATGAVRGDVIGLVFGPFVPEDLVELPGLAPSISTTSTRRRLAASYLEKIRRVPGSGSPRRS